MSSWLWILLAAVVGIFCVVLMLFMSPEIFFYYGAVSSAVHEPRDLFLLRGGLEYLSHVLKQTLKYQ